MIADLDRIAAIERSARAALPAVREVAVPGWVCRISGGTTKRVNSANPVTPGARLDAVVTGDKDPGYGSTSKMIAETALTLVDGVGAGPEGKGGGIWTPGALLGAELRERLVKNAGLTFTAG